MSAQNSEQISVEVVYALPQRQKIIALTVVNGSTAFEAVVESDISKQFTEIDLTTAKMGVFGKAVKAKDYLVREGDRIEIYRPLQADPKAARKARAAQVKQSK